MKRLLLLSALSLLSACTAILGYEPATFDETDHPLRGQVLGADGGGTDAPEDGGVSAELDAGAESSTDSGAEAANDAGGSIDASLDTGADASVEAAVEAGLDAGFDVGVDAGVDAGLDGNADGPVDAGTDGFDGWVMPPHCYDGVLNFGESDVDCGKDCLRCALGRSCGVGADCVSGVCGGGMVCQ